MTKKCDRCGCEHEAREVKHYEAHNQQYCDICAEELHLKK